MYIVQGSMGLHKRPKTAHQQTRHLLWQVFAPPLHGSGRLLQTKNKTHKTIFFLEWVSTVYLDPPSFPSLKEIEDENIQKRDWPDLGPSFMNSCPSPFPHLPQETLRAEGDSSRLDTLSGFTVSVKAGQGDECLNFFVLRNSSLSHCEHT